MKGAVNVISIIMISGIIISLVGASYMWSVPLLQKQQDNTAFQTARSFILSVNDGIIDIANSGSGETSFGIPMGSATLVPYGASDENNNSLLFEIPFTQPLAFETTKTHLGGASYLDVINTTSGVFGESSPSIITMELKPLGPGHVAVFQMLFRELVTKTTPPKKYIIALNKDIPEVKSGSTRLIISYGDTVEDGQTTYTKINVNVV